MINAVYLRNQIGTRRNNVRRWLGLLVVFVSLFGGAISHAGEDQVTPQISETLNADETVKDSKQCSWSCLKWSKLCNVDPRGVYKCRRTCANFGEVCEE